MLTILYIFYILSTISSFINDDSTNTTPMHLTRVPGLFRLSSTKIRDNKLYALYNANEDASVQLRVYELKEDLIANIFNSGKTFNLTNIDNGFNLVFFDALDELEKDGNKLWVKSEREGYEPKNSQLNGHWIGYINLNDMSLNQDPEILKFPTFDNFPVIGYAMSAINNSYGASLYVTGGELYSKSENNYLIIDSFYKYNFTSKVWIDMKNIVKGIFSPLNKHKSFEIDNRYLMIIGGMIPGSLEDKKNREDVYNSIYNLRIFDTFTNNWSNIMINSTVVDTSVNKIEFYGYLAKVYKNQILALGGWKTEHGLSGKSINNHIGILDLKSKSWTWSPIIGEDGFDTESKKIYKDFQIFNDQVIMFSDYDNKSRTATILVYDLLSQRTKSTLRLPYVLKAADPTTELKETQGQSKALPVYAITLISVGCIIFTLVLSYLLYFKYKKKPVTKNNAPIREVWSNSITKTSQKTIMWDKRKGIYINPNMPSHADLHINTSFNSQAIEFNK